MRRLPPFPQALIAGAIAALLTSVLLWLLTITGLFAAMGVPVAAPPDPTQWIAWRIGWGCVYALLLLLPLWPGAHQTLRGMAASVVPMLKLFLWDYPRGHEGWFGLDLGLSLPVTVIVTWLAWGAMAGWLLGRWGFGVSMDQLMYEDEDESAAHPVVENPNPPNQGNAKRMGMTILYLVGGPLLVLVTIPIVDWTVTGGILTAFFISAAGIWSIWRRRS